MKKKNQKVYSELDGLEVEEKEDKTKLESSEEAIETPMQSIDEVLQDASMMDAPTLHTLNNTGELKVILE